MKLTVQTLKDLVREITKKTLKESEMPPEEGKNFLPCEDLQLELDALSAELFDAYGTRDEERVEEFLRPYIDKIKAEMKEKGCK